jgi:ABC-type Fe3+ transport system substrate-binding protein
MFRFTLVTLIFFLWNGYAVKAADATLIAAAKKEGEVVWYTTRIVDQIPRPVAAAFEKRYGVKVLINRSDPTELAVKVLYENKARNPQADVFDGTTTVVPLKKAGYVLQWLPDSAAPHPAEYEDPDGFWIADSLYVITPGFNTQLVPEGTQPLTYKDLLDPKWRGRMAWNAVPSVPAAAGFIGTVLAEMGEEPGMAYLRELSEQKIVPLQGSARQALDQVIAGEYAIALQILNNHVAISRKIGAPVDWIKMEPVTGSLSVISVNKSAPHPNAAKLLVDFIISTEGQQIFCDADYLPASPEVPALEPALKPEEGKFRVRFFTPEQAEGNMPKWKKIFNDLFR